MLFEKVPKVLKIVRETFLISLKSYEFSCQKWYQFYLWQFWRENANILKKVVSYYIEIQLKIMNFCTKNGTKFSFANFGAKIQMEVSSRIIRDNFGNRKICRNYTKSRFYCTLGGKQDRKWPCPTSLQHLVTNIWLCIVLLLFCSITQLHSEWGNCNQYCILVYRATGCKVVPNT